MVRPHQAESRMTLRDVIMQLPEEDSSLDSDEDKEHYLDQLSSAHGVPGAEPKAEAIQEVNDEEEELSDKEEE